ncbi:MAG: TolC family protein [Lentisphaeraceae bacterium]|nr:TolC family protein [Lentisphaeraceae bacterium]
MKTSIICFALSLLVTSCSHIEKPDYAQKRADSYKKFATFKGSELSKVLPLKVYTLNDCLEQALNNNLELYAMKLAQAVSDDKAMAHLLRALPSLQTSYSHTVRSNNTGATSEGIEDGEESLRASKSTDNEIGSFRLELALSSLDFGLAYINRHFEMDQKRKAEVNRAKAQRELKFQVVQAFYSVASAQYVLSQTKNELSKNEQALLKLESLFEKQHISQFELLRFKRKFLETRKQLREYERSHENACFNLTALLGLYPDRNIIVDLSLFSPKSEADRFEVTYELPAYEELEKNALHLREELIEMDIESHISLLKEKAELLKMFPNVRLFSAYNNNSNSFLYNKNWSEIGFNVLMDFMSIPSHLKNMSAEEKQRTVIQFKQYSTMLNIIAQLKIAHANIEEVKERLSFREDIHKVIQQEKELTIKAIDSGNRNQLDLMEKDIDLLLSHIQRTAAFANYNVALHRLLSISAYPQQDPRDLTTEAHLSENSDE